MNRHRLMEMFERQQAFAAGYSPLYSRLFGAIASWLSAEGAENDPLVSWLFEAAGDRSILDVTLLLAAGLHRDVLAGESEVTELANYYPTAGGNLPPEAAGFEKTLRAAILGRSGTLARIIRKGKVQTNETARGLCWLLPSMLIGWQRVHLVDLGASAGLNLLADLRSFHLVDTGDENRHIDLGQGERPQFITRCHHEADLFDRFRDSSIPAIESRTGCDASPFLLETEDDEISLMSFIWGDQVDRMDRLCEGIEAYRVAQESNAPVRLYRCNLPQELGRFLDGCLPADSSIPVVIYNTYITAYLPDKGMRIADEMGRWASQQARSVLWFQWEPARDGQRSPFEDWIAWTADLWQDGNHRQSHLGWVHPHGGEALFEGEWKFAEQSSAWPRGTRQGI